MTSIFQIPAAHIDEHEALKDAVIAMVQQAYRDGFAAGIKAASEIENWPEWKRNFIATTPRGQDNGAHTDDE